MIPSSGSVEVPPVPLDVVDEVLVVDVVDVPLELVVVLPELLLPAAPEEVDAEVVEVEPFRPPTATASATSRSAAPVTPLHWLSADALSPSKMKC